jgi:hypothetical protein
LDDVSCLEDGKAAWFFGRREDAALHVWLPLFWMMEDGWKENIRVLGSKKDRQTIDKGPSCILHGPKNDVTETSRKHQEI